MTTSPSRLTKLEKVLAPLKPFILSKDVNRVFIHISKRGYRNQEPYQQHTIERLQRRFNAPSSLEHGFDGKVQFNFVDMDYGPITKILPAKARICALTDAFDSSLCDIPVTPGADPLVISIDDDYLYHPEALQNLVRLMRNDTTRSVSAFAYKTGYIQNWGIPRSRGGLKFPNTQNSTQIVEGWGKIIYRVVDLDDELMKVLSQVSLECKLSDDLVISYALAIENRVRRNAALLKLQDGMYNELTDIYGLSGGSGLSGWFNQENWQQFIHHIKSHTEAGGIVLKPTHKLNEQTFSAISFSDIQKRSSEEEAFTYDPTDRIARDDLVDSKLDGDVIKVFGHRKVGFIGQQAFINLVNDIESQYPSRSHRSSAATYPSATYLSSSAAAVSTATASASTDIHSLSLETSASASASASAITPTTVASTSFGLSSESPTLESMSEKQLYERRFQALLIKSRLKIDGFKYKLCLERLNQCTYDAQGQLKSRDQILIDCGRKDQQPEVAIASASASAASSSTPQRPLRSRHTHPVEESKDSSRVRATPAADSSSSRATTPAPDSSSEDEELFLSSGLGLSDE